MKTKLLLAALPLLLTWPALAQTTQPAPDQPSTTEQTTTAQTTTDTAAPATRDDDDDMDWGWIGLLGLIGLAGLMGRRTPVVTSRTSPIESNTTRSGTGRL